MSRETTGCMHRNRPFFGEFEVIGDGPDQIVRVHYQGEALECASRSTLPEVTAHHLLKELVVMDIVKLRVRESTRLSAW